MKKIIVLMLVFTMLISFAGCGVDKEMIANLQHIYDEVDYAYQMTRSLSKDLLVMEELIEDKGKNITFDDFEGKFALSEEDFIYGMGLTYYDIMIALDSTEDKAVDMCNDVIENPEFGIKFLADYDYLFLFNNILIQGYRFYIFGENDEMNFEAYIENIENSYNALNEKYGEDEIYVKLGEYLENVKEFYEFLKEEEEYDSEKIDEFNNKANECYEVFAVYFEG